YFTLLFTLFFTPFFTLSFTPFLTPFSTLKDQESHRHLHVHAPGTVWRYRHLPLRSAAARQCREGDDDLRRRLRHRPEHLVPAPRRVRRLRHRSRPPGDRRRSPARAAPAGRRLPPRVR